MHLLRISGRLLRSFPTARLGVGSRASSINYDIDDDWKPGDYPTTEAERLAAAKKYNLLPEEYEAYDPAKWEICIGDYPRLPNIHYGYKDPYHAYDYVGMRCNFGEPLHAHELLYTWFMPEPWDEYDNVPLISILEGAAAMFALYCVFLYISWYWCPISIYKPIPRVDNKFITYYHYPKSKLQYYD